MYYLFIYLFMYLSIDSFLHYLFICHFISCSNINILVWETSPGDNCPGSWKPLQVESGHFEIPYAEQIK